MVSQLLNYSKIVFGVVKTTPNFIKGVFKKKRLDNMSKMFLVYLFLFNIFFLSFKIFINYIRFAD